MVLIAKILCEVEVYLYYLHIKNNYTCTVVAHAVARRDSAQCYPKRNLFCRLLLFFPAPQVELERSSHTSASVARVLSSSSRQLASLGLRWYDTFGVVRSGIVSFLIFPEEHSYSSHDWSGLTFLFF